MSNSIETDGCARDIGKCYGDHQPNGHFYANDVGIFYFSDGRPNEVRCGSIEKGRCGVRVLNLRDLSAEQIMALPPCIRLTERYTSEPVSSLSRIFGFRRAEDDPNYAGSPYHW